ncbi:MAG: hypothetical protein MUE77_12105 [Sandarakinorhabdus sp.]|nr:hypothetical protein [Sandarakinorhabdus sp.]
MPDSFAMQQQIDQLAARAVQLGVMGLGGGCNARDWANILWALDRQQRIPFARIAAMSDQAAYDALAELSRRWAGGLPARMAARLAALEGRTAQVAA